MISASSGPWFETAQSPSARAARPLLGTLGDAAETVLPKVAAPSRSQFQFQIDDVPYYSLHEATGEQSLTIWAVLGYMPYTAESPEKRRMLIAILHAAQPLKRVKIGVNAELQIVAVMRCQAAELQSSAFIFQPLVEFLQEARPFITLIGDYL